MQDGTSLTATPRLTRAGAIEMVIRKYVSFHSLRRRLTHMESCEESDEGQKVAVADDESDGAPTSLSEDEALARKMTQQPKKHFYWFQTPGGRRAENASCLRTRCVRTTLRWINAAFLCGVREKAIFDKWDEFRSPGLDKEWNKLIYGEAGWNSVEAVENRLRMVRESGCWDELEARRAELQKKLEMTPVVDDTTTRATNRMIRGEW